MGLENLRFLSLSNNRISQIDANAFKSLTYLEELDLSMNQIEFLDHLVFCQLICLGKLDLSGNPIANNMNKIEFYQKYLKSCFGIKVLFE